MPSASTLASVLQLMVAVPDSSVASGHSVVFAMLTLCRLGLGTSTETAPKSLLLSPSACVEVAGAGPATGAGARLHATPSAAASNTEDAGNQRMRIVRSGSRQGCASVGAGLARGS